MKEDALMLVNLHRSCFQFQYLLHLKMKPRTLTKSLVKTTKATDICHPVPHSKPSLYFSNYRFASGIHSLIGRPWLARQVQQNVL